MELYSIGSFDSTHRYIPSFLLASASSLGNMMTAGIIITASLI
jgi:hypothetical protein